MSHFRLEFDIVQRSRGGSALHMSAYQARGQFAAPGGQIKDYSSRGDHIATLMFAPAGAPDWINDPQEAWRRATFAEKRWDAQEARIVQLSLPRGLSRGSWEDIARRISAPFVRRGLFVQADIHCTVASDGGENPHLHFLIAMRALVAGQFAATKDRHFNKLFHARAHVLRSEFAAFLNAYCKRLRVPYHADSRSNADRGLPLSEPNMPRWNFVVFAKTGKKTRLLEQRDRERALRETIRTLETECEQLALQVASLQESSADLDQAIGPVEIAADHAGAPRHNAVPYGSISPPTTYSTSKPKPDAGAAHDESAIPAALPEISAELDQAEDLPGWRF